MTSSTLRMQHTSLQFSDTAEQQKHDVRQLFISGKDYPIKTGTEGGAETATYDWLRYFGKEFKHSVHVVRGNWIAVDQRIIKNGTFKRGEVFVAKNDIIVGKMHDRLLATVEFEHQDPRMGHIAVGCAHYATKGQRPGDPNYDINKRYAERINTWMKNNAQGSDLAFVNGDFNMVDSLPGQDWAFGGHWTSMADELKAWENTGHGPIDGFASYDRDGRVSAKDFDVLRDGQVRMFSDHYVVRGEWKVKHLNLGKK